MEILTQLTDVKVTALAWQTRLLSRDSTSNIRTTSPTTAHVHNRSTFSEEDPTREFKRWGFAPVHRGGFLFALVSGPGHVGEASYIVSFVSL